MNTRLLTKAKDCLDIMEAHLPTNVSPDKSKTKAPDSVPSGRKGTAGSAPSSEVVPAHPTESAKKKKRGRSAKNAKAASAAASASVFETELTSSGKQKRRKTVKDEEGACVSSSSRPRRISRRQSVPTLQQLVSRFEEQYEEMGERYREMGNILTQMKSTVANGRERTEEEIRMDVLDEVQKTITKTFKKK